MKTLQELRSRETYRATKKVIGGRCIEDIPKMFEYYKEEAEKQGFKAVLKDSTIDIEGTNQFIFLPKMSRETTGLITMRSKDYTFQEDDREDGQLGYGNPIKKANLRDYGFCMPTWDADQSIEYHLEEVS